MSKKKFSDADFKNYFNDPNRRNKKVKKNGNNKKLWLILTGILALVILGFALFIVSGLPSLEELENPKPQLASKVYAINGELLGQFFIENRIETNIDSLPLHLIEALIATEDRRFYDHWGVDISRFVKAMIKNVFTFSREGASTITQQLAKNLYNLKSRRENSFETAIRKIREWITALQIEKNFTKEEILELYLNVSYFGRSAYGIESAAKIYFDKTASQLTLPESALFIALLKSPENYDPVKNRENSVRRRNLVMYNMVSVGLLDEREYDELKEQPIVLASEQVGYVKSIAPHFMEYVRKQLEDMSDKYGYNLYRDGINIYTTIDLQMQRIANKAVAEHLKEYQEVFNKNWNWNSNKALLTSLVDRAIKNTEAYRNESDSGKRAKIYNSLKYNENFVDSVKAVYTTIQTGFVVIDPSTGHIKAMVGGENQKFGRGLNHVTGIRRQPGSSFKPIIYTTAIDNGYYPAYSLLNQKFDYDGWSPDNSNDEYGEYMTLREGLANSVNVIAGRLTISDIAPPSQVVKYAHRMGIKSNLHAYPSIALGTSEVTPLELTSAYGTFANKGIHVEPISILKIEDNNGIIIDQYVPEYTEVISPQTASIITDMMQDVIAYGTGAGVRRYFHRPAAGKTGTTQNYSDAWFVGFTPQLVAGVWVGFDDHRVKFTNWYGQGAKAALPIWAKFMEETYKDIEMPLEYFELAPGVITVNFCKESIMLGNPQISTPNCPGTVTDIINAKYVPRECEIHSELRKIEREERGDTHW